MVPPTKAATEPRTPLSRERVLRAAVALADESGIDSLTMRKLGEALGVEAMSLYNHVANKVDLLDGMVDLVFSEKPFVIGRPRLVRDIGGSVPEFDIQFFPQLGRNVRRKGTQQNQEWAHR